MLDRTNFTFVEGYLATKKTLEFDSWVFPGLNWVSYTWHSEKVHSIGAHKYVRRENHKDVSAVHKKAAVSVMLG